MQLSKILYSIASLALVSQTVAAPFDKVYNQVRAEDDDDEGPVVVKLTKTVHNIVTNTHVVKGEVSTLTNTVIDADTTTTTRYTATVTSTVFGTPITYTTEAPTPIDTKHLKIPTETETTPASTTTASSNDNDDDDEKEKETTTTSAKPSPSKASTSPKETKAATTSQTTVTASSTSANDGPTITDAANIPSSTGTWIIDNVTTSSADGVCDVNYDYYGVDEPEETVTSTKTIYTTVTKS